MRFGSVPLSEAKGGILAHSLGLPDGRLRKGRVLTDEDIARLAAAGETQVVVARLDPGDLDEDAAALVIAQALVPEGADVGLRLTRPAKGRVNVIATGPGIVQLDAAAIARINATDPMITLATLPDLARVADGAMVATVKIIAYGLAESLTRQAVAAAGNGVMRRLPPVYRDAALIETRIGGTELVKGEAAIAARLEALGMSLSETAVVPHDADAIARAVAASTAEMVLILTASATSDPRDTAPEAVRIAGGTVTRFGMPVDPGNLLFLGRIGERPVIGLPGCARSPAMNGADFVLERMACGLDLTVQDIAALGVGGLLKEVRARGRPRSQP